MLKCKDIGITEKKLLLVFFGMIATGKSFLAAAFARRCGCSYYNSDVVRKELAGLAPDSRQIMGVGAGIYSSEFSRRTYDALLARALNNLEQEKYKCVILDGSYQSHHERQRLCEAAGKQCRLLFIYCHCPETILRKRLEKRLKNPRAISDGRWEIYLQQKKRFEMPDEINPEQLFTLNTDKPLPVLLRLLDDKLRRED
jgi:uncharacterized protein